MADKPIKTIADAALVCDALHAYKTQCEESAIEIERINGSAHHVQTLRERATRLHELREDIGRAHHLR